MRSVCHQSISFETSVVVEVLFFCEEYSDHTSSSLVDETYLTCDKYSQTFMPTTAEEEDGCCCCCGGSERAESNGDMSGHSSSRNNGTPVLLSFAMTRRMYDEKSPIFVSVSWSKGMLYVPTNSFLSLATLFAGIRLTSYPEVTIRNKKGISMRKILSPQRDRIKSYHTRSASLSVKIHCKYRVKLLNLAFREHRSSCDLTTSTKTEMGTSVDSERKMLSSISISANDLNNRLDMCIFTWHGVGGSRNSAISRVSSHTSSGEMVRVIFPANHAILEASGVWVLRTSFSSNGKR